MSSILSLDQKDRAPIEQLEKSKELIDGMFKKSSNDLTNIIQENLQIEQHRSHLFKTTKKKFSQEYEDIQKSVADRMEDCEHVWQDILDESTPLEMKAALEEQKARCDAILKEKLDYIKELENEVLKRDHEYVNKTAEQKKRIDDFVHQMRQQEMNIKRSVNTELQKIQAAYIQERNARSFQIDKEVKALSAKRQEREAQLMNEVIQKSIEQRDALESLRQQNSEAFLALRTALEFKLQTAQKEHEDRRAQYIHSFSQLEYDYRILQENKEEHQNKVKLQNDKKTRQREIIRRLIARYKEEDAQFIKINEEITHDYKRIAQSYRELQSRFRNVAYTDFNNFREVWNYNEKRLHELVLKIIEADRVVMEQQLGKPPRKIDPDYLRRWIIGTDEFEDLTKTPQLPDHTASSKETKRADTVLTKPELSEPLEHLRKMISDEVGFIVDERVKDLIGVNPDIPEDQQKAILRTDALLEELGITDEADAELLMSYFTREPEFKSLERPEIVSQHEVVEALGRFVEAYHPNKQQNQMSIFAQITNDATQNTSSEVARAIKQLQAKMNKQLPLQRKFWEKKAGIITEDMWRLWNITFKGMQRYNTALENRAKLITDTERLKEQNAELEVILSRSIAAAANDDLIYPPPDTVDFNAFEDY